MKRPLALGDETSLRQLARGWASAAYAQRAALLRAGVNLALVGLWIKLFYPLAAYFEVIFTKEEFRTNQILLAAIAGLLLYRGIQAVRSEKQAGRSLVPRIDTPPRLHLPALALMLGGALGFVLVERFFDVNTVEGVLFGLASYGLLGLWLHPRRWRQGFPAALLVTGVLPFGAHLETFAGYPLRIATAEMVRAMLAGMGFNAVGADTILVFESGISQVDIPCSGVKSLWTGALFLLAAAWIEDRPINLRWLLIAALTMLLLVTANLVRVAALALSGPALGLTMLAEMLHLPLGMLGFSASCAAALLLMRRMPARGAARRAARKSPPQSARLARPSWLGPLLALAVLGMVLAYAPRAQAQSDGGVKTTAGWQFPAQMAVQPAPLTAQELEWIREGGAENAERYQFTWGADGASGPPVRGTLMLVTSQTWRGQHRPELCFQVFGYTIRASETLLAAEDFPLRSLSLSHPALSGRSRAAYWLQSASQTTDDYGRRIWADLRPERERWVLVTILFDQSVDEQSPQVGWLYNALRASVARSLEEGR